MTDGDHGGTRRGQARAGKDEAGRRWLFGHTVFDELSFELIVDGQRVEAEQKPLRVLAQLLRHAGTVVTKEDLAQSVWPGRILSDSVVSRAVSSLRAALRDRDQEIIETIHGFGYRFVIPVRAEAVKPRSPPVVSFEAGDRPPLRPNWKLEEKLGNGGHGEAWLVRHEKTGEQRVFKFAAEESALISLKREITLSRVLRESAPATATARILDWNLDDAPYFVEMEYVAGRDLVSWAAQQGGLENIPLSTRLELVAQIAETLGAAHSVGVLHKDVKPGNVLVDVSGPQPRIKLCDFGSGALLDATCLDRLNITQLGFTTTLTDSHGYGTPLYLAPEIIKGQLATVKADIYSLGVILYQMLACDFRKTLTVGWEADVADPLLLQDVADAANGNIDLRLAEAGPLAERLRAIDQRRERRHAEMAERERTERAKKLAEELRKARLFAAALGLLASLAASAGVIAYRARSEAVAATNTSRAITDFLMRDVLRVEASFVRPAGSSYEALLTNAAKQVDNRLGALPEAAGKVHLLLGQRLQEIGQFQAAISEYEHAVSALTTVYGSNSRDVLLAMDSLAWAYVEGGRKQDAVRLAHETTTLWLKHFDRRNLGYLAVLSRQTRVLAAVADLRTAEVELRSILSGIADSTEGANDAADLLEAWLGISARGEGQARMLLRAYVNLQLGANVLEELGRDYRESEAITRDALQTFDQILGSSHQLTSYTLNSLAGILLARGNYREAERLALMVQEHFSSSLPPGHFALGLPKLTLGRVREEQRRYNEAIGFIHEALELCSADPKCPPRFHGELLGYLGIAYQELGQTQDAIGLIGAALVTQDKFFVPGNPVSLRVRIHLADAFRQARRYSDAKDLLSELEPAAAVSQPALADLRRVQGLLAHDQLNVRGAIAHLRDSLEILTKELGPDHWRTQRARQELERVGAEAQEATTRKYRNSNSST